MRHQERTSTYVECPHCWTQGSLCLVGDAAYRSGIYEECDKTSVWSEAAHGFVLIQPGRPDEMLTLPERILVACAGCKDKFYISSKNPDLIRDGWFVCYACRRDNLVDRCSDHYWD
jgi:hypothetical protein